MSASMTKPPKQAIDVFEYMGVRELLRFRSMIFYTIRGRETRARHSSHPIGDYAKYLFARSFGWKLEKKSTVGYDATHASARYLIRGRRFHLHSSSRKLGAIRRLPEKQFDFLAAVLFNENHSVCRAAIIPHELIEPRCRYSAHANAWAFVLEDPVWELPGVRDVTQELARASLEVDAL